jgi:hypothetical protein
LDKQARKARIEKIIAMEEELHTFEELPRSAWYKKLAEWAEQHLSSAEQEWLYQQWQRALQSSLEDPSSEPAP